MVTREATLSEGLTKVGLTNLDKVLFPKMQITKAQVIEYYIKVAPKMLAYLADRPLVLTRFPNGIDKEGFYAKDAPEGTPPWVKTARFYSQTVQRYIDYILCNDLDTLIWLANLAAIEIHIPLNVGSSQRPDFILFDMDPEPPASYENAADIAILLKEKLERLGHKPYAKTSGKRGLHIVIPIVPKYSFQETRAYARAIGEQLAKEETEIVTTELAKSRKSGKVFVDYLQNSHRRTMVSPYSLRVVQEASVSTPLNWDEVKKKIKPTAFNIFSVIERQDAWQGILGEKQELEVG
jgi:bifunctional non-homologous end joining protein LigD